MLKFTGFIDLTDKDRHTSSIVLKQRVHMEQLDYFASSLRYNELIVCACFYPTFFFNPFCHSAMVHENNRYFQSFISP